MDTPRLTARRERIATSLALAATRLEEDRRTDFDAFAQAWFAQLDDDDANERLPEDLAGALLSQWQFGSRREVGRTRIRVLSPTVADDGWSARHTVVEVVQDDMPFLVDSATLEINRQGLTLHLIVHPVLSVQRSPDGRLMALGETEAGTPIPRESWMHIEVDRLVDEEGRNALLAGLERALADVRATHEDWPAMRAQVLAAGDALAAEPALPTDEAREAREFLNWLVQDHFVLLGSRQHDLVTVDGQERLRLLPGTGLGVLRETEAERQGEVLTALPAGSHNLARDPTPLLVVTKSSLRSTVHRGGFADYVGVKRYDDQGRVVGEHRFLGLFTSSAYQTPVAQTPLLRGKVAAVLHRAGLPAGGHRAKVLAHILETYPRDELFQIGEDELLEIALGILALGSRQRLRLFLLRDPFERFVSCLLYVPREAYSTDLRMRCQQILMQALGGHGADYEVTVGTAPLARIHFRVRTTPGAVSGCDRRELEARLATAARRWSDQLRDALVEAEGEARGLALFKRWASAFPADYQARVAPRAAVSDVNKLATLGPGQPLALALYRPLGADAQAWGLRVYRRGAAVVLSDSLPMLERMGMRVIGEHNHRLDDSGVTIALHDFELQASTSDALDPQELSRLFEDALMQVFEGQVENDDFNRLVLAAGMPAQDIVVLRAYARYCKQIGFPLSQATIEATLAAQPRIAHQLLHLFRLRLDPMLHDDAAARSQVNAIEQALDRVRNLSEDRVLRQLLGLIEATLRTNWWRTGVGHSGAAGSRRPFLAFKFDCVRVPGLPSPRPMYEIFVYSPRFEGVHLRGGKVARGGLRWSDRPEDFRTEVLGLMKAQMVKNTVIVPVGSKGGFVLKKAPPPAEREAWMAEGIACYQDYLRALLDLTDNRVAADIVPPPQVRRLDGDDPYLVVAADKGTASFSDHANAVSAEYGHWLGDAFASGGSVGYDHKAMGITARGAWESVKRCFRERGVDIQSTDFTVAGIGDMSGDVFGNGMRLSRHIRLVAAFDHRHIFLDPDPDAARAFEERERLFHLPRSSWADYDPGCLSVGGGVWSRQEKQIPMSPAVRARLAVDAERLSPSELVSAILRAPVDLLYNGGIGTYVKAREETHAEVGDRANDAVRINGGELRCLVVGEGGNLGFTQRGRVEAALAGVALHTDAIDNSAGVDTSDHEVNIKILLGMAVDDGELTLKQRNALLAQMTDEVAALVLRDNYFQTQCLALARRQGRQLLDQDVRFMRFLEKAGRLDRALEGLPDDDELDARRSAGGQLTTPERAVLLAYGKMWLFEELLASDLPEDAWVSTALQRHFPRTLRERMATWIPRHPLRREIVATHVLNSMVNRVGPTFVHRLSESGGTPVAGVVRAYLLVREVFRQPAIWQLVQGLDNRVPDALQAEMLLTESALTEGGTGWFLRSRRLGEPMAPTIERLRDAADALAQRLIPATLETAKAQAWVAAGVPEALAARVAAAPALLDALDIAEVAEMVQCRFDDVGTVHVGIERRLGLGRLRSAIETLPAPHYWDQRARAALGEDLADLHRSLTHRVLVDAAHCGDGEAALESWAGTHATAVERAQRLLADVAESSRPDLAMLSVAMRQLRALG